MGGGVRAGERGGGCDGGFAVKGLGLDAEASSPRAAGRGTVRGVGSEARRSRLSDRPLSVPLPVPLRYTGRGGLGVA